MGQILKDAGLPDSGKTASIVLRALAQNTVVFVDHPEMYRDSYLGRFLDVDVTIECNRWLVAKWVSKAGGGDHVYSFDSVPENIRAKMVEELDASITKLQGHLLGCPFDPDPGFRGRRR